MFFCDCLATVRAHVYIRSGNAVNLRLIPLNLCSFLGVCLKLKSCIFIIPEEIKNKIQDKSLLVIKKIN